METIKGLIGEAVMMLLLGVGEPMEAGEHMDFMEYVDEGAHGCGEGGHEGVCHAMCLRELCACNQASVRLYTWMLATRRM